MRRPTIPLAVLALVLCACGASGAADPPSSALPTASAPASTPEAVRAPASATAAPRPPDLVPPRGTAWFGMNLDWANETAADVSDRLGRTPSVWVQFVAFPLDDGGRGNLDAFVEQIAPLGGIGLITLEPHGGLETVTPEAAAELADLLAAYWHEHGVSTLVRFAHEMNGSWYPWGQQPGPYVDAFRTVADAVHAGAPASAMAWAPNEGAGYPFSGGAFAGDDPALDTDGDGTLGPGDDPYALYWPGDDAVDWVGMSLYHWGNEYPWGENELPAEGSFRALLTGGETDAHAGGGDTPDFYAEYAEQRDKPMGIFETAALYNPDAPGAQEQAIKAGWWSQVTGPEIRADFPRLAMVNWFEWRKDEPEVGGVIDWRMAADADFARRLMAEVPEGWLRFDGTRP